MISESEFKSGYASIIGKPNVGKSTLLNRLVMRKIAAMSRRPQTTRNKNMVVVKPKKFVDSEAVLTAEEEKLVAKGFAQIQKGEYETLDQLKHELDG